jgi:hypothetical protein
MSESDGGGSAVLLLCYGIVFIVYIAAWWRIFTKADKPGWAAIVPIYNYIVLLEVIGRPVWWIILMFIPLVNIIIICIMYNDLSKSFGFGIGYTLGLLFLSPIFFLHLGFSDASYVGPAAAA